MGVQYGIMNAMLDSNTVLLQRLNADFILVNPTKASLLFREAINRRRMEQALGCPASPTCKPVYLEYQLGNIRHTAAEPSERTQTRRARIIGVDPNGHALNLPEVSAADWAKLNMPGTALYDRKSRPHPDQVHHPGESVFGKLAEGMETELMGRKTDPRGQRLRARLRLRYRRQLHRQRPDLRGLGSRAVHHAGRRSARRGRSRRSCGSSRARIAARCGAAADDFTPAAAMSMC